MVPKSEIQVKSRFVNTFNHRTDSEIEYSWTHVKEIPNTNLLVSLHHNAWESASMEVFEISKEEWVKKIYSLGEVSGGNFK